MSKKQIREWFVINAYVGKLTPVYCIVSGEKNSYFRQLAQN